MWCTFPEICDTLAVRTQITRWTTPSALYLMKSDVVFVFEKKFLCPRNKEEDVVASGRIFSKSHAGTE